MATITGTLGADRLAGTNGGDLITGHAPLEATAGPVTFTTVTANLGRGSLFAAAAPGDSGNLHVAYKDGFVRIVDAESGAVNPTPFLDISGEVATAGEQGLIGMAFHPDYWTNGKLYVFFSGTDGDTRLREYRVDLASPDTILPGSGRDILTVPQPGTATNHKGGWIGFGPDGMLHIATGDGGPGNDPRGTGQDPTDLLGSILRIDVNGDGFPADPARNYAIPADNPFANGPFANGVDGAPEVWAYGLRNPYRDSFDRGTGDLWIADVGQATAEEVNIGAPGANFGWRTYEGGTGPVPGFTFPVHSYGRQDGDRSVTGGYVSRGPDTGLFGEYVFGDFASGRVWSLADRDADGDLDRTVLDGGATFGAQSVVSFGEDGDGTLHVVTLNGRLVRISGGEATGALDGADVIAAGGGDDRVFAGAGNDRVSGGTGDDLLSGMEGSDALAGEDGDDLLIGGRGADRLDGGAGADSLLGGLGDDRLVGGAGADLLLGGAGADALTGGDGADRFRWTAVSDSAFRVAADRLTDFDGAEGDRLDLSALIGGTFAYVGDDAFTATGAQVRVLTAGANQRVEVSLDGGPADMVFVVAAAAPLTAADFIL